MTIPQDYPFEFFVHEAGHVVAGQVLGAASSFVGHIPNTDQPFATSSDGVDGFAIPAIAFAGLWAEVAVASAIVREERLLTALEEIMVGSTGNPNWSSLDENENRLLRQARADIVQAGGNIRLTRQTEDPRLILKYMENGWSEARRITQRNQDLLVPVAKLIADWHRTRKSLQDLFPGHDAYNEVMKHRMNT
jgi:hypothetical protein